MAATASVTKQWFDGKKLWVQLKVVLSGSYVSGGDVVSLVGLGIKSSQIPFSYDFQSGAGTAAQALNSYTYVPGTTQANGLIRCFIGAVAELAAGAYPAAATGDLITGSFTFELR